MVKINTVKKMNLIELINWAFENDVHCKSYITNDEDGNVSEVTFDVCGIPRFSSMVSKEDTFTVEVEEEVTGETILPEVVEFYVDGDGTQYSQRSINELKDSLSKEFWLKDGNTMTLIWKDGELVGDE